MRSARWDSPGCAVSSCLRRLGTAHVSGLQRCVTCKEAARACCYRSGVSLRSLGTPGPRFRGRLRVRRTWLSVCVFSLSRGPRQPDSGEASGGICALPRSGARPAELLSVLGTSPGAQGQLAGPGW